MHNRETQWINDMGYFTKWMQAREHREWMTGEYYTQGKDDRGYKE